MHWNCLSGTYLGFEAWWTQWHLLQVSTISGSWKISILGDIWHKMGLITNKVGWDLSSSPPGVPFCPYTMFQNPVSWPSHKKCRKTTITQKVFVTQSSNIVHYNCHTQNPIGADLEAFANTFSLSNWCFSFSFLSRGAQETAKILYFVDFDWAKCIKMAWVAHI